MKENSVLPVQRLLDLLKDYPDAAAIHLTAILGTTSVSGLRKWLDNRKLFPDCMALTAEHRKLYIIPAAQAVYGSKAVRVFAQVEWAKLINKRTLVDKGRTHKVATLRRYYVGQLMTEYTELTYPTQFSQVTFEQQAQDFQLLCTLQKQGTCATQVILTCVMYADRKHLFMCFEPLPRTLTEMLLLKQIFKGYPVHRDHAHHYVHMVPTADWIGSSARTESVDGSQCGYDTMTILPFSDVTATWLPLLKQSFSVQKLEWGIRSLD